MTAAPTLPIPERTIDTRLVREIVIKYAGERPGPAKMLNPSDVAAYLRDRIDGDAREHFVAIFLDARNRPIGDQVVSIGTATKSLVSPREVFQPAVAVGAVSVILGHNHPSGDATPSVDDRVITKWLAQAGAILGIQILDHVVWSRDGSYTSLRESHPDVLKVTP